MYQCKYPHLFEPITLGRTYFRNRIFASPTGYQNVATDGILTEFAPFYYSRKAQGGAASVATCEIIVDGEFGKGGPRHTCADDPAAYMALCRVANAITRYGAVATAELQHAGMFANRSLAFEGAASHGDAYGPVEMEVDGRIVKPMDEAMIERTIKKYADAAATMKRAGFGMILIHGGHGWGLSQFLSPYTNTRTDKWGGPSVENRARLPVAICDAIRKAVGPGFPIEFRMSGSECFEGGYGIEEGIAIAKQLEGHVDLIHVSAGSHEVTEVFTVTHPRMFLGEGPNVKYAAEIKKNVKTPVATVGALGDPDMMEEIIASGQADVVEIARSLIADPDLPTKARMGLEDQITPCLRCLSCFSNEVMVGEKYCAVNPASGYEFEQRHGIPKADVKKKVLVAGGGIGGMQAAISCALRGHEVILCEKSGNLGGILQCEKDVPFKRNLDRYMKHQIREIERLGIDVRLNTEVTPEFASSLEPEVLIASLGSRPVVPPIPGIDGKNVYAGEYIYTHTEKAGNSTVILGGGLVGLELALFLAGMGKKITVIEMLDHVSDGGNFLHMEGLLIEIEKAGVELHLSTRADRITEEGVYCTSEKGEEFFAGDSVIYSVGMRPNRDAAEALRFCAPEFYMIGDCITPKNITAATSVAFEISNSIGRF